MGVNLERIMRMSEKERSAQAREAIWEGVASAIEHIAINRRVAEVSYNISPEEFDQKLNEICNEKNAMFCDMDETDIHMYMLREMLMAGNKDVIDMITSR